MKPSAPSYDAVLEAKGQQVRAGLEILRGRLLSSEMFEVEKGAFIQHMWRQPVITASMASASQRAQYINNIVSDYMRDVVRPKYLGGQVQRVQQHGREK